MHNSISTVFASNSARILGMVDLSLTVEESNSENLSMYCGYHTSTGGCGFVTILYQQINNARDGNLGFSALWMGVVGEGTIPQGVAGQIHRV